MFHRMCGIVVLCALLAMSLLTLAAGQCSVVPRLCDNTWRSGMNQTFAFLGVAPPNVVQLYSYWGTSKGCVGAVAVNESTALTLSWAECSQKQSVWWYGPGSIKTYVYYNNSLNQCLTLSGHQASELALGVSACCAQYKNCTASQAQRQMWIEPNVQSNPYSRIVSQFTLGGNTICLTRIGDSC